MEATNGERLTCAPSESQGSTAETPYGWCKHCQKMDPYKKCLWPWKYEDQEEWRPVVGYADLYDVSNHGRVRRALAQPFQPGRIVKGGWTAEWGYRLVRLTHPDKPEPTTINLHILVAKAWLGPKPTPEHEVCHNDGIGHHNHVTNLRWGTSKENKADREAHGTTAKGERNGRSKLRATDIPVVLERLDNGEGTTTIARDYGVDTKVIRDIRDGKKWKKEVAEYRKTHPKPPTEKVPAIAAGSLTWR